MQLNKASKKTRKIADETKTAAPETNAAADVTVNPRTTRSSTTKKTETTETGSMKHRHNKGNAAETAPAERESVRAAAAGATGSVIVDAVGVVAPATQTPGAFAAEATPRREVTQEEIAKLAYSYWIARGHSHGGAQEDWLRAERELRQR